MPYINASSVTSFTNRNAAIPNQQWLSRQTSRSEDNRPQAGFQSTAVYKVQRASLICDKKL